MSRFDCSFSIYIFSWLISQFVCRLMKISLRRFWSTLRVGRKREPSCSVVGRG